MLDSSIDFNVTTLSVPRIKRLHRLLIRQVIVLGLNFELYGLWNVPGELSSREEVYEDDSKWLHVVSSTMLIAEVATKAEISGCTNDALIFLVGDVSARLRAQVPFG